MKKIGTCLWQIAVEADVSEVDALVVERLKDMMETTLATPSDDEEDRMSDLRVIEACKAILSELS